jgi:hypothetical protein
MEITNSCFADTQAILDLYEQAISYQKAVFSRHWHSFDQGVLIQEIQERRHWKILINEQIAFLFSVTFEDPMLWEERNADPSVYLHRMVGSPTHRGYGFVRHVVEWALVYGRAHQKKFIRLDTCADNVKLNAYYLNAGFSFWRKKRFKSTDPVPKHYLEGDLNLYQIAIPAVAHSRD